jgi:hypothetical protein
LGRRYFQSLHRILPRKQSLFVPEDSVVRESQQGMLQVKIRAFLRRSRYAGTVGIVASQSIDIIASHIKVHIVTQL